MDDPKAKSIVLPPVKIRRGAISEMTIYDVSEDELERLAHGAPDSMYLNFAVFLLSVATSLLTSLITSSVSERVFIVFVVVIVLGFIFGPCFLILWIIKRRSTSSLIEKIRERLPGEAIQLDSGTSGVEQEGEI